MTTQKERPCGEVAALLVAFSKRILDSVGKAVYPFLFALPPILTVISIAGFEFDGTRIFFSMFSP